MATKFKRKGEETRLFQEEWTSKYLFAEFNGKPMCLVCKETLGVLKVYNLKRHFDTKHATKYGSMKEKEKDKLISDLKKGLSKQQSCFQKPVQENKAITKASYIIAQKIAKASKPFTDGEFIKDCMKEVAEVLVPDKKKLFEMMSLSRNTVVSRIEEMSEDIGEQLSNKSKEFALFSLAFDESNDMTDTAQLSIFIRGITEEFVIQEDILSFESLHGQTCGVNVKEAVMKAVAERLPQLSWNKLAGLTTDGAPAMVGKENGCVALIKKDVQNENADQDILAVHCIVHQEALCGKIMNLNHVMDVVLKCVNEIRSKGLKHREFQAFLEEIDAEFKDVPYHTEVRWLSRGRILERFLSLRKYIEMFVNDKMPELKTKNGKLVSSFFSDPEWLLDLAFLVDITQHLNSLNTRLQGRDQLITELMNHVKSFQSKLVLFQKQLEKGILLQFKSMQTILSETVTPPDYSRFVKHCEDLKVNFEKRFQDLHGRQQSLSLFENPFLVNAEDFNDADLQMEILDIQANSALQGFFANHTLVAFYERVDREKLPLIHHNACFWAVQFGSTYVCEQAFSRMKVNKSKYRTKITDKHLDAILRLGISPLKPNVEKLLEEKRMQ